METIICLMPNDEHLAAAKQELAEAGFAKNKIGILFQPADVWQRLGGRQKVRTVFKWAAAGALLSLLVGAIYGVPVGIFNCIFMNCPLETGIILWALISLFWVIVGGIMGAIIGLDKLENDLYSYVEGVRRGEALMIVQARPEQAQQVMQILHEEQGSVIHELHEETEAK